MITIPENDEVYAVTVDHDECIPPSVPPHVKVYSRNDASQTTGVSVDGQALANALAELGYTPQPAESDTEGLAATVDRLIDRVGALENATATPVGARFRDSDNDVWTVGDDGRMHLTAGSPGCTLAEVRDDFGPLVRLDA